MIFKNKQLTSIEQMYIILGKIIDTWFEIKFKVIKNFAVHNL